MEIGFIGLGNLGKAVVNRLMECGHELTVYNRSLKKCHGLGAARIVKTPKDVNNFCEIIFMCLFDSEAVENVLVGENGILNGDFAGKILIDLTTHNHDKVLAFHKIIKENGGFYLEAPVLGSVVPASKGALTILVSGEESPFKRAENILRDIGKHIFFLKEAGLATKMKLINNLVLGTFMAVIAEAVAFGEKIGMDRKQILDILSVGGGDSLVLNAKKEKLMNQDFSTHFSNALIYKDLHCLQELAYKIKQPVFTGAVVKELYGQTCQEGMEQLDFSSVYKLFER